MIPSKQISYFRIGSFVITGIVLLVVAILVLGSGMLFKKVVYVETYFNESVQGLVKGSPVKYLGMEIGHVGNINTISNMYDVHKNNKDRICGRYIYVEMAISTKFFGTLSESELEQRIKKDVAVGLRFKLAPQGLTGNVYIELDYVNPATHPLLPVYWHPEHIYIPSTTSTLTFFTDNVQSLLRQLKKINVALFFRNMQQLVKSTNKTMNKVGKLVGQTDNQIVNSLDNLQGTMDNLHALSEQARSFPSHILFAKPPPQLKPGAL